MSNAELPSSRPEEADAQLRAGVRAARDALDAVLTKMDREGGDAVAKHPTISRIRETWSTGGPGLKALSWVTLAVVVAVVVSRFVAPSGISVGAVEFLSGALLALGAVAFYEGLSARRALMAKEDDLRAMIDQGLRRIDEVQSAIGRPDRAAR